MAISEKMHVSKQTRTLGQAATERVTLVQGNPPNREAFLSIRIWNTGENGQLVPLYWDSGTPAVCLTADLIAASGGEPVSSNGGVLVTSFHSDHVAISAARRLQWAIQGFTENRDLQGISVVVLVHSAEELSTGPAGDALRNALDQASGGQILLTEKASQFFEDLPGFASQTLDGTGLRELQWRSAESHATRSFDEQWLTNYIQQQGLEEQLSEPPVHAEAPDQPWKAESSAEDDREARSGLSNPKVRWAIGGVLAAALAVGAVLFFTRSGDKQAPQVADRHQPPSNSANSGAGGAEPAVQPKLTPPDEGSAPKPPSGGTPTDNTAKPKSARERNDIKHHGDKPGNVAVDTGKDNGTPVIIDHPPPPPPPKPEPKTSGKGCDIDSGQINSYLGRADKALGSGNYSAARRLYGEVLPCPEGAARARAGLERVRDASGEGSEPQN